MSIPSIVDKFLKDVEDEKDDVVTSNELFKERILSLMTNQSNKLNRIDYVQAQVMAEILRKVDLHEMEVSELLRLNKDLSTQKNQTLGVILEPLKPTTNTGNPFLPPAIRDAEDNPLEGLTQEHIQALQKMYLLLTQSGKGDTNNQGD